MKGSDQSRECGAFFFFHSQYACDLNFDRCNRITTALVDTSDCSKKSDRCQCVR